MSQQQQEKWKLQQNMEKIQKEKKIHIWYT